jgi:hypothetical protein
VKNASSGIVSQSRFFLTSSVRTELDGSARSTDGVREAGAQRREGNVGFHASQHPRPSAPTLSRSRAQSRLNPRAWTYAAARGSTNACRTRCASSAPRRGLLAAFYLLHAGAGAGPNTPLQRIGAARLARRLPAALEAIRWRSSLPHRGAGDACRRGDRTWSGPSSLAGGVTDCVRAEFGVSCVRGRDVPARIPLRHRARCAIAGGCGAHGMRFCAAIVCLIEPTAHRW